MRKSEEEHLTNQVICLFVSGELPDTEQEAVLKHLSECEECLEKMDQQWKTASLSDRILPASLAQPPHLPTQAQTMRRIHRTQLGTEVIWLSTVGFAKLVLFLVKPFFAFFDPTEVKDD